MIPKSVEPLLPLLSPCFQPGQDTQVVQTLFDSIDQAGDFAFFIFAFFIRQGSLGGREVAWNLSFR